MTDTHQRSRGGGKRLALCVVFALVSVSSVDSVTASDQKHVSKNLGEGKAVRGGLGDRRGGRRGGAGGGPPAWPPPPPPEKEPIFGTFVKTPDGGVRGVADTGGYQGGGHPSPGPESLPPPIPPRAPLRSSAPLSRPRPPSPPTDTSVTYADLKFPVKSPAPPFPQPPRLTVGTELSLPGSHGSPSSRTTPGRGAARFHLPPPEHVSTPYATLKTPAPDSVPPVPPPRSTSLLPRLSRAPRPHRPAESSTGGGGSSARTQGAGHKED